MTPNEQRYYDLLVANIPITDLAKQLEVSRTQVYRIVTFLEKEKFIKNVGRGQYKATKKEPIVRAMLVKVPKIKPIVKKENKYPSELMARLKVLSNKNTGGREVTREIARYRDDYTCQDCGLVRTPEMAKKEGKRQLDIHHLNGLCGKMSKSYDKISTLPGLITLCHKCHFNRPEHTTKKILNSK